MRNQESLPNVEISNAQETARLAYSIYLLTRDADLAFSSATQVQDGDNAISSLDLSDRIVFTLHHMLGFEVADGAAFAQMKEDEFRAHLRSSHVQLASTCQFVDAECLAEPALA